MALAMVSKERFLAFFASKRIPACEARLDATDFWKVVDQHWEVN